MALAARSNKWMPKVVRTVAVLGVLVGLAGSADAWNVSGRIVCAGTGLPLAGIPVSVTGTGNTSFSAATVTDANGFYFIPLLDLPASYSESIDLSSLAKNSTSSPSSPVNFSLDNTTDTIVIDFIVTSTSCQSL